MSLQRLFLLACLLLSGCLFEAREATDEAVRELATRPFDLAPR